METELDDVIFEQIPPSNDGTNPKLYAERASWWPLMSPRSHYCNEAEFFTLLFKQHGAPKAATLLELGSGGGHLASYLSDEFVITLSDLSEGMLTASRALNPDCEHIAGDMRSLRTGCEYDIVIIHDAIHYMTTLDDLERALMTAALHCREGGLALFVPDHVAETFVPGTRCQDTTLGKRRLRFMETVDDFDPTDNACTAEHVFLFEEQGKPRKISYQRLTWGVFSIDTWLAALQRCGFEGEVLDDVEGRRIFLAKRT
ncbi:class I SAM-dependent methyltransferase [Parerythrobacter aestuarii]|uniref:class I SAM-dependent methyltransferase n=1 Tax=Parerythrobacter aestuarii TaxID=3020909 RepID=UPI0024DDFC47|nr:class I SAM-dependent methyltransferase [Parerythrobacter aestuarii]